MLTIAGSDSGGASGIQADLKTFAALGVHGLSVITAVTAQNMHSVAAIHAVPARQVRAQLRAVLDDFRVGAVKIGMLGTPATIDAIADCLRDAGIRHVVVDPVLIASSGQRLLSPRALTQMRTRLLPLTEVLTPNLPEAEVLLGRTLHTLRERREAATDLLALGPRSVLLKGGHCEERRVTDHLADSESGMRTFTHTRLALAARGTGCTLASAIAAGLAEGLSRFDAIDRAQRYLQRCLRQAYRVGAGHLHVLDHTRRRAR